jgi:hypothetical protein
LPIDLSPRRTAQLPPRTSEFEWSKGLRRRLRSRSKGSSPQTDTRVCLPEGWGSIPWASGLVLGSAPATGYPPGPTGKIRMGC